MTQTLSAPNAMATEPTPATGHRIEDALATRLRDHITTVGKRTSFDVRTPFTGEVIGSVPLCESDDVAAAVTSARAAQPTWAAIGAKERGKVLLKLHDLVLAEQAQGLDLVQLESGKARAHAFEEVTDVALVARYYAHTAGTHLKSHRRWGALPGFTKTVEHHHARGVVGVISPWNYPLSMAITDAIAALAAGNAVILRPDQQSPFTALWTVDLLRRAGLPRDVLQVVTGPGPDLGPPIIAAADYVMFTGSTATGRRIAQQCAERLIGCSLELGGKNPMIVLADADLDAAVAGAVRGSFASAGQLCMSMERIYVEEPLYDRFVEAFGKATSEMRLGSELAFGIDMGSLVSEKQLKAVTAHVDDAVAKGATVVAGGKARPDIGPLFYEPTVLTNVKPGMDLACDETFGPVVSIYPVADAPTAVELANDSEYGLNACIFTKDTARGAALATLLKAGTVNINEAYAAAWGSMDAPMGGMKSSGLGRRHGREGLLKYTESQTVAVQRGIGFTPMFGMSEEKHARMLTRMLGVMKKLPIP